MKSTVVFNKHTDSLQQNCNEQEWKATKRPSHTVLFDESTVCITQQSEFLANYQSKKMLVKASKTKIIEGRKSFKSLSKKTLTLSFLTKQEDTIQNVQHNCSNRNRN